MPEEDVTTSSSTSDPAEDANRVLQEEADGNRLEPVNNLKKQEDCNFNRDWASI